MEKKTQLTKLLKLFQTTPVLSVRLIDDKLKLNSPRKCISDLRAKGYPIHSRWVEHINPDKTVTRYKEYWLPKNWETIGTTCFDCLYRDIMTDKKDLVCKCPKRTIPVNPYRPMVIPNRKCPFWKEDENAEVI